MSKHAVTIRNYKSSDGPDVVALWRAAGLTTPHNDPVRDIARKVAFQPDLFLVAETRGQVAGTAMVGYEGHRGWIYYLAVAPDFRNRAIGRSLLAEAESRLRERGCPKVNLMVRTSNLDVAGFYRNCGFVHDEVVCMGKRLVDDRAGSGATPSRGAQDVRIRPYEPSDAKLLYEAALESVREVYPWLPWCRPGYSLDDATAYVARSMAGWSDGSLYDFAIVDNASRYLGGGGLNSISRTQASANLGYWLRTSATRRGVATAAVRQVAEFAWHETELERLEIVVAVDNTASRRVAERAGAIPEGIAHSRLKVHGVMHDAAVYALLRHTA